MRVRHFTFAGCRPIKYACVCAAIFQFKFLYQVFIQHFIFFADVFHHIQQLPNGHIIRVAAYLWHSPSWHGTASRAKYFSIEVIKPLSHTTIPKMLLITVVLRFRWGRSGLCILLITGNAYIIERFELPEFLLILLAMIIMAKVSLMVFHLQVFGVRLGITFFRFIHQRTIML